MDSISQHDDSDTVEVVIDENLLKAAGGHSEIIKVTNEVESDSSTSMTMCESEF